jgi:phosphatidylglycerophosphate synthase
MALKTLNRTSWRWPSSVAPLTAPERANDAAWIARESIRAASYPLSRWYLRPAAGWLAVRLASTRVRPWHLSVGGLLSAGVAAVAIATGGVWSMLSAALVLLAWFFDRADGLLARRQGTTSPRGAWLDANIDELTDVGLHMATAWAAYVATSSAWPVVLLIGFLGGKHLLMHGLATEPQRARAAAEQHGPIITRANRMGIWRRLYHLPANADVRLHMLVVAVASGWLTTELAFVAAYYSLRALARFGLVCHRLPGGVR